MKETADKKVSSKEQEKGRILKGSFRTFNRDLL